MADQLTNLGTVGVGLTNSAGAASMAAAFQWHEIAA